MKKRRIPVYIITGFLGSGKTTLLLHLLESCHSRKLTPAIILNELGEINVEKPLFTNHRLIELLNGCICCTIQQDLSRELKGFLQSLHPDSEQPDLIIIEGTGIANPLELIETLSQPEFIDELEIHNLIGMIDASKFLEYQSFFSSSKEVRTILKDQVRHSSILVLNKIDLATEKQLKKARQAVQSLIPANTLLLETKNAEIDLEVVWNSKFSTIYHSPAEEKASAKKHLHSHSHGHGHHHHHSVFQTLKIDQVPMLSKSELEKWLSSLPKEVLRAKGVLQIQDHPTKWVQFQYASNQVQFSPVMDEGKHASCLILIGTNLDNQALFDSYERAKNNWLS